MKTLRIAGGVAVLLAVTFVVGNLLFAHARPARGPQPACLQNACAANCVDHVYVLGNNSLDRYVRLYESAFVNAGCTDPNWWTAFQYLVAIAAELVGAPGGYTMDCRSMIAGQYTVCSGRNYCGSNPCLYAPNARVHFTECGQGSAGVTVDNERGETLPEYAPTAYTRAFDTSLYLQREGGESLLLHRESVTALAYSNWVISGGYQQCLAQYGDDPRCQLLSLFVQPTSISFSVDWGDGLYDMRSLISASRGMSGSPANGYVKLMSDGDSVTFAQGDVSGWVWQRTRTKSWPLGDWSDWTHTLERWDASSGARTITNNETNSLYHWSRTDRDTFVFVTHGPSQYLLTGDYTLRAEASLHHDKDTADNTAQCTFTVYGPPPPTPTPAPVTPTPCLGQRTQTLTPGDTEGGFCPGEDRHTYTLQVPSGLRRLDLRLFFPWEGGYRDFDLTVQPSQLLPANKFFCEPDHYPSETEQACYFIDPPPGTYQVYVDRTSGAGTYILGVTFTRATPTPARTATPSPTPWGGDTESEPNDAFDTATRWSPSRPMRGRIGAHGDQDYYRFVVNEPAIYTLRLASVPPEIAPQMTLYDANHNVLASEYARSAGQGVSLSFDGNASQVFYVRVKATSSQQTSQSYYELWLAALPDPHEPNDSFATATPWDWRSGPIQGYFWEDVTGPGDYYRIEIPSDMPAALLTVRLEDVPQNVRPNLVLYNGNRDVVASGYASSKGVTLSLTIDVNPGEAFYVRVKPEYSSQVSDQPYTLLATIVPDPYEPNDSFDKATSWDWRSGPIQGYFWEDVTGPGDYYRIEIPPDMPAALLTVHLQDVPANVRPNLVLYDGNRNVVASGYAPSAGQSLVLTATVRGAGPYYVRVSPEYASQTSDRPYTLSASATRIEPTPTHTPTPTRTR